MTNIITRIFQIVILTIVLGYSGTLAQNKTSSPVKENRPGGCESNDLVLEGASHEAGTDTTVVLIAFMGEKDTKKSIMRRRLYTAKAYLVEYLKRRPAKSVVTGESREDFGFRYGGVMIFVKGKRYGILSTNRNADLPLGGCDPPDSDDKASRARRILLYPWTYKPIKN